MTDTSKLAAALAQVQAKLPKLERDREVTVQQKNGGEYSYSYVTLAHLSETVLPLLAEHGLAFTAMPGTGSDGKMCVRYRLMHSSGEFLEGEFPVSGEGGIQMVGGRITYIRRYCLAAVVGVAADEDDESQLAAGPRTAQRAQKQQQPKQQGGQSAQRSAPPLPGGGVTNAQLTKIAATFNDIGWSDREDRLRAASAIVDRPVPSSTELTKVEARTLIEALERVASQPDPADRLTELLEAKRANGGGS